MRVLLTGSRTWVKRGPIEALMLGMKDAHFILGDNPNGLDGIAHAVAHKYKLSHYRHIAHWNVHEDCYCRDKTKTCKPAGNRRNGAMVADAPDVGFAFRAEGPSPGTDDCTSQCFFAGIPVYRIMPITEKTEGISYHNGFKKKKYNSLLEGATEEKS